ncbi:TAPT1 [Acrasis kona]|uniref:TAPT1 n=1 Tax=Acrasis kona TaxID=1008807 RepID=A0AAW2ZCV6_9EUKA
MSTKKIVSPPNKLSTNTPRGNFSPRQLSPMQPNSNINVTNIPVQGRQKRNYPASFMRYLQQEFNSYATDEDVSNINETKNTPTNPPRESARTEATRRHMYNTLKVPVELEKLLFFGFLICLDTFLYFFTFLPLRLLLIIYTIIMRRRKTTRMAKAHLIDLVRGLSLIINVILINLYWDYSHVYHIVRGESALKLYVIYNMLEVFDRLCSAFGQDVQDSLYFGVTDFTKFSNVNEVWKRDRKIFSFLCAALPCAFHIVFGMIINTIYLYVHTLLQLFRVITLNVALNSQNNALFTLLVSNNFVELKGNVFKKVNEDNLMQVSCGDILERFQIIIYGILIFLQNARSAVFGGEELLSITTMFVAEIFVDAIKHAFIAKYNDIRSDVYGRHRLKLCEDLATSRRDSFLENSSAASTRIGFIEIPMVALSMRVFMQSAPYLVPLDNFLNVIAYLLGYVCLFALKILLSVVIVGYASQKLSRREVKVS